MTPATIYERDNYNGEFNLKVGERDRIMLVLNGTKSLTIAAEILDVRQKHLYNLRIKHRIIKGLGAYSTKNKWED